MFWNMNFLGSKQKIPFCLILNQTGPNLDTMFLARNCRGCKLSSPAQTNKQGISEEKKLFFFLKEAIQSFCSLDYKLVQKVSVILFFVCMQ